MFKKKIRYKKRPKENIISTMCVIVSITLIAGVLMSNLFLSSETKNSNISKAMPRVASSKENKKESSNSNEQDAINITNKEETKKDENDNFSKQEKKEKKKSNNKTKSTMAESTINLNEIGNPVNSNEILMDFSYNTAPVYSKTFEEYRSDHTGIDLKANEGEEVKAVLSGEVTKSYKDDKMGYTVIIMHPNNTYSIYSNLAKEDRAKKGELINKGDTIGKVSNTAPYEIAEDTHLHFEIRQNKTYIDPKKYLK